MPRPAILLRLLLLVGISGVLPPSPALDASGVHGIRAAGAPTARSSLRAHPAIGHVGLARAGARINRAAIPDLASSGLPTARIDVPPPTGIGSSPTVVSPARSLASRSSTRLRGPPPAV